MWYSHAGIYLTQALSMCIFQPLWVLFLVNVWNSDIKACTALASPHGPWVQSSLPLLLFIIITHYYYIIILIKYYFSLVHHIAPISVQWPLAQLFSEAWDVSTCQCSVYLSLMSMKVILNGRTHFKQCKQLLEYKHFLLLRDIWWSKF